MILKFLSVLLGVLYSTNPLALSVHEIVNGLDHPWALEFLPDRRILITERKGNLRIIDNGQMSKPISGLPKISTGGQGGLLDVAIDPNFSNNKYIYLAYVAQGSGGVSTEVGRGRLLDTKITAWQTLFRLTPKTRPHYHFGARLILDSRYLYITLGDRGKRGRAQDLEDHAGSVIRLYHDGTIPADNPFVKAKKLKPEIFSYGHRNIQGAVKDSKTGIIWLHEHGPQGGDELNLLKKGKNYGWPVITYGKEYGIGLKIGVGTHKHGMEQPTHYWVPSIAPSGMDIYYGKQFPTWNGDILLGSLKFGLLVRLSINAGTVKETRYLHGKYGRIRDVKVGPDGFVWLLTDKKNGQLLKIAP